jgi:hypothetical protein
MQFAILKAFFFVVCFVPITVALALVAVYFQITDKIPIPLAWWYPLCWFYWIGSIIIAVHLWCSTSSICFKLGWTLLFLFFGVIAMPVYWVAYIAQNKIIRKRNHRWG